MISFFEYSTFRLKMVFFFTLLGFGVLAYGEFVDRFMVNVDGVRHTILLDLQSNNEELGRNALLVADGLTSIHGVEEASSGLDMDIANLKQTADAGSNADFVKALGRLESEEKILKESISALLAKKTVLERGSVAMGDQARAHQLLWDGLDAMYRVPEEASLPPKDKAILAAAADFLQRPETRSLELLFTPSRQNLEIWESAQRKQMIESLGEMRSRAAVLESDVTSAGPLRNAVVKILEAANQISNVSYELDSTLSLRTAGVAAAKDLGVKTSDFKKSIQKLQPLVGDGSVRRGDGFVFLGFILMGFSAGVLALIAFHQQKENNRLSQAFRRTSILRKIMGGVDAWIKRVMSSSGSLDLTQRVLVKEVEEKSGTGGALNKILQLFSDLAHQVEERATEVGEASKQASDSNLKVFDLVKCQRDSLTEAKIKIQEVSANMVEAATRSSQAQVLAISSLKASQDGGIVVRDTIRRMDVIRDTIQDTSKRIKRLGESSQGIGAATDLIRGIARQVQVLSMNAAIEAAAAGDAGRNFSVVAQEIQRLANSSNRAAKKIDELVVAIQEDAQGAVSAMENSTAEVVDGAALADKAGVALKEIETISTHLAEEVVSVAYNIEEQANSAISVSNQMDVIQGNSEQELVEVKSTVESVERVYQLSAKLRALTKDFKS